VNSLLVAGGSKLDNRTTVLDGLLARADELYANNNKNACILAIRAIIGELNEIGEGLVKPIPIRKRNVQRVTANRLAGRAARRR
jgi:hypothetical protein